jgi:hypothetical protein
MAGEAEEAMVVEETLVPRCVGGRSVYLSLLTYPLGMAFLSASWNHRPQSCGTTELSMRMRQHRYSHRLARQKNEMGPAGFSAQI